MSTELKSTQLKKLDEAESISLAQQFYWISNWLEKHQLFQTLDVFLDEGLKKLQINDTQNVIFDERHSIEVVNG